MKRTIKIATYLLVITLLISMMPTDAEANIYEDTIRLHILANSDSGEDQELKIAVRDGLLSKYGEKLRMAGSFQAAESLVLEMIPEIEAYAKTIISKNGYSYNVRATVSREWYETRDYEGFSLPCGYYTSLRILIGEGEGKNWWCVMYPPMCLGASTAKGGYTSEEEALISKSGYVVKSKLLELVSSISRGR